MNEQGEGLQDKPSAWRRLARLIPRKPVTHTPRPPIYIPEETPTVPQNLAVSEAVVPPSEQAVSPEIEFRTKWMEVVDRVCDIVTSHDAIDDFQLCTDSKYPWDLYIKGDLGLWVGLIGQKDGYPFPEAGSNSYVVSIKNIQVREALRNQGIASEILACLEGKESGAAAVVPTNIKDQEALQFWQRKGYTIPQSEEHKERPYYLYKKIVQSSNG